MNGILIGLHCSTDSVRWQPHATGLFKYGLDNTRDMCHSMIYRNIKEELDLGFPYHRAVFRD